MRHSRWLPSASFPRRLRGSRASESAEAERMSERAAYLRDGAAIYERSFAIIRAEADLSRFSAEEADVAVRMIHACGQVDVAQHIVFGGDLVAAARGALGARRADPLRCRNGGARRYARAAPGDATKSSARSTIRAPRRWRRKTARRARRPRSICGATASPARWSPSAMRRPRCSACSNCSMPARQSRPPFSASRSASSARRNRRKRWRKIRAACLSRSCAAASAAAP